jgi:hypothetical protein
MQFNSENTSVPCPACCISWTLQCVFVCNELWGLYIAAMRHCLDYERRIKNLTQKVALNKGLNDGNKKKAPRTPSTHAQQLALVCCWLHWWPKCRSACVCNVPLAQHNINATNLNNHCAHMSTHRFSHRDDQFKTQKISLSEHHCLRYKTVWNKISIMFKVLKTYAFCDIDGKK